MTGAASHPFPDGGADAAAGSLAPQPAGAPARVAGAGGPDAADAAPQDSRAAAPPGGMRPAPPPPPAWPSAANDAATAAEATSTANARADRRHARHRLGDEPPARIAPANSRPVFVTLNDISHGGCCIVRRGRLELSNGDAVMVDIWTEGIDTKISIHARVCWCSHEEASSRAGLRFVETNHRLLHQIDTYVRHFHQPRDDSRPQPRQAGHGNPARTPAGPARADLTTPARPPTGRARRDRRSPGRSSEPRELASMPRPARLTSLDLQRRMRPAHRHEVARIAEETGIHIHTLYSWLRTLRLEGEVNPERPRDPEAWSATDKFSALLQVAGMGSAERAAWCSRHDIREEQLTGWRQAALQANAKPLLILRAEEELQRLRVRDQREIRRLQKELRRRERSATIGEELLQVVRKLQTLWEQDDNP